MVIVLVRFAGHKIPAVENLGVAGVSYFFSFLCELWIACVFVCYFLITGWDCERNHICVFVLMSNL
jgi:hypothetical protein